MRTIKFRGKDIETGEWIYGHFFQRFGHYPVIVEPRPRYGKVMYCEIDVEGTTVGQFTGLTDKNGKEIYEGDILRGDEYPYNCDGVDNYFVEIVWADNVCGFYRITHKKPNSTVRGISHGNWSELDEEDIKSFEVIGNIHDNPKLLKTETL
ncbi:MAG: hypothetical protein IJE18_06285 [Bacteroidaceae bacterium]|nr:hypothetical protein [Bacteroidaceae bacterium]MBQ3196543.1 hypothetical protein [Alistipes sp.]